MPGLVGLNGYSLSIVNSDSVNQRGSPDALTSMRVPALFDLMYLPIISSPVAALRHIIVSPFTTLIVWCCSMADWLVRIPVRLDMFRELGGGWLFQVY